MTETGTDPISLGILISAIAAMSGFVAWLVKSGRKESEARENRQNAQNETLLQYIRDLNDFIQSAMLGCIDRNTKAFMSSRESNSNVRDVLRAFPCVNQDDVDTEETESHNAEARMQRIRPRCPNDRNPALRPKGAR